MFAIPSKGSTDEDAGAGEDAGQDLGGGEDAGQEADAEFDADLVLDEDEDDRCVAVLVRCCMGLYVQEIICLCFD